MSRIAKRFQRLLEGPRSAKWDEVQTILRYYGCTIEEPNGSHWIVYHHERPDLGQISIPVHGNRIKLAYVKRLIQFLEELTEEEGD